MKVVVVGASGNVGTAVLWALRDAEDVTGVGAVARRVPRGVAPAPYDLAKWTAVDVGGEDGARVIDSLADAMEGASAVIQLAWIIQPNHERETLRRVNVLGTARVLAAARHAGVPHVVVASSVAAYAPCQDDAKHDESWPLGGIPSSEYSADKAAVEFLLDDHERQYPEVLITRLRPALIFQRVVGAQVMRNFMLPAIPAWAFRGVLPVAPFPAGVTVQAVHADDVAQAYLAAVRTTPGGAINIAADDVVGEKQLATLLAGGRSLRLPPPAMRGALWAGWQARAVAASPGWLDMAGQSPLISTDKARSVLGWAPQHSALDTVAEVLRGMADGAGTSSPPLRPRGKSLRAGATS